MRNFTSALSKTFAILTASVIAFSPADSFALSFGKLRVESDLGQPLRLQIPLESVSKQEAETLDITLGSREDFDRAGVEYPDIASILEIELIADPNGRYHVEISTQDPVQEAYLHVLLSAVWAGGKAIREYTALLDPPMYSGNPAAAVTLPGSATTETADDRDQAAASVAAEIEAAVAAAEQAEAAPMSAGSAPASTSYTPSNTDQVVVSKGDTLSQIVANMAKPTGINTIQALEAVFRKNPRAFINNNMNLLLSGATLQVPSFDEMQNISRQESVASYTAQLQAFNAYRNIATSTPATQSGEAATAASETAVPADDQLAVATPLPPLTPEDLGVTEEARQPAQPEQPVADTEQPATEEPAAEAPETVTETEVAAPQQAPEPRLTIGQQEVGSGTEGGAGTDAGSNSELEALRIQLAQLDESLLASGVESNSVRQNLQQIQDQVERISSLIQVEDKDLAQAQSRAAAPEGSDTASSPIPEEMTATETTSPQVVDATVASDTATEIDQAAAKAAEDAAAQQKIDNIIAANTEQPSATADNSTVEPSADTAQSDDSFTSVESAVNPEASVEQEVSNESEQPVAETSQDSSASSPVTAVEESAPTADTAEATESTDDDKAAELVAAESVSGDTDAANDTDSNSDESESGAAAAVRKVSSSGIFDSIKELFSSLPEYGLKIAVGLLVLLGGLFLWQRRKSQHEYDASMLDIETEEVSSNSEASIQRMSKGSGIDLASANDSALELTIGGGMSYLSEEGIAGVNEEDNEVIKAGEVDPLAEADVYLAYDRDEQAIQVLKEAFADTPERGELAEKLLEIYHKQDDRRSFDALAAEMQRRKSSTNNFSWERVAAMGREVSPDNSLYTSDSAPSSVSNEDSTTIDLDDVLMDTPEDSINSELASRTVDDSIDVDQLNMLGDASENTEVRGLEVDDLDFDIEKEIAKDKVSDTLDAPTLSQIVTENVESKLGMETDDDQDDDDDDEISLGGDDLNLDLGDDEKFNQIEDEARRSISAAEEDDDDDDDLGIDAHSGMSEMSEASMSKLEPYHESETALELAKAYLELGEQEIAKGFIEEVLTEGSEKQKGKARELIKELAS